MHLMIPDTVSHVSYTDNDAVNVNLQHRTFTLQSCVFEGFEPIRIIDTQQAHFIHLTLTSIQSTPRLTWELDIHVTDGRITYTRTVLKNRILHKHTGRLVGASYCWDIASLESKCDHPCIVADLANAIHNVFHLHILPYLNIPTFHTAFQTLARDRDRLHDGDLYRFIALQLIRPTQRTTAARRITRMLKRAFSDPSHPMCQKRLLAEFEELPCKKRRCSHF